MNEAFVAFWSTLILICRTSRSTLCGKSCDLERKYVVFATPVSQKRRRRPIFFILDSLSAQMNVPNTKFSRKTMKHLNHNASTLKTQGNSLKDYSTLFFLLSFGSNYTNFLNCYKYASLCHIVALVTDFQNQCIIFIWLPW